MSRIAVHTPLFLSSSLGYRSPSFFLRSPLDTPHTHLTMSLFPGGGPRSQSLWGSSLPSSFPVLTLTPMKRVCGWYTLVLSFCVSCLSCSKQPSTSFRLYLFRLVREVVPSACMCRLIFFSWRMFPLLKPQWNCSTVFIPVPLVLVRI